MKAVQAIVMLLLSVAAASVTGLEVQATEVVQAATRAADNTFAIDEVSSRRALQTKCKGGSSYSKSKKRCTCAGVAYYDKKEKKCKCPKAYKKIIKPDGKAKCVNLTSKSPKA